MVRDLPKPTLAASSLVIILALTAAACTTSSPSPSAPAAGSGAPGERTSVTVLVGSWGNGLFDPATARDEGLIYERLLHAFLIEGDETRRDFLPGIATDWEMSDDGRTWTFTIAPNIIAHNGEAITAEDVAGTWDALYGDTGKARVAAGERFWGNMISIQDTVESVEQVGPDKVAMTFIEPDITGAYRMSVNSPTLAGVILPMDYFNEVGPAGYEANPVGIGPFSIASYEPGREIVFERFEDYYYQPKNGYPEDRRAKVDEVIIRLVEDPATRLSALEAGQADVITTDITQVSQIEQMGKKVIWSPESSIMFYTHNQCWLPDLWCYNPDVKHALDYAVDQEAIVQELYGEAASVTGWNWVTPGAFGYRPTLDPRPYDPARAVTMLAEAGFPEGNGIPPITIYVTNDSAVPFLPEVAQIIAADWQELGLEVDIHVADGVSIKEIVRAWRPETGGGVPGSIYLNSDGARWLGLGPLIEDFAMFPVLNEGARLCGEEEPVCLEIDRMIHDLPLQDGLEAIEEPYSEIVQKAADLAMMVQLGTVSQPWGVGEDIELQQWPMSDHLSAWWTLDKH